MIRISLGRDVNDILKLDNQSNSFEDLASLDIKVIPGSLSVRMQVWPPQI